MQPLHPIDAISPAFARTRQVILTPFKFWRSWKLAACSYLAFAGSIFVPFPLAALLLPRDATPPGFPPHFFVLMLLIPFALHLALFYVGNRMGFVEFELLVTRAKFVAPIWKRYGARTWPYLALKMIAGTAISLALFPLVITRIKAIVLSLPAQTAVPQPGTPPDLSAAMAFFTAILSIYAFFIAWAFLLKLFDSLLNDFVLPFYAIEEIPLFAAIGRGWDVVRREPGQVLLYLLLKLLLAIAGYVCLSGVILVFELVLIVIGALGFGLGALVMHLLPGPGGHVLVVAGAIVLGGALYVAFLVVILGCSGYLFSLLEAYAIYFLGGRYQKLGDYLQPPDYTFAPPPLPPSDDEEDGGPSLPMDPALV